MNQIAEYTYNGAGQRIKKVTQTETKIFHYDQMGHLIAETNESGQMMAEYMYLGDQLLTMIKPGEAVYYYHNDHLGTPRVLTSEDQTVAWKAAYAPFGGAVISVETAENPFRFPGQYYDQETGLHYNYFRYYDPTTGRYVTPDPIGLEGGINLFLYVESNPVNFSDIEGLLGGIDMGESYGEMASLYWATLAINPNNAWYQTLVYTTMGLFASLWTPTTSEATVSALALGYGAGRGQNEPYWRYTGPNSKPDSPWMTRGCEGKPPYGTDFGTAQDRLQIPHTPTDVKKIDVPWYQPVRGPRPADKNPLLGTEEDLNMPGVGDGLNRLSHLSHK